MRDYKYWELDKAITKKILKELDGTSYPVECEICQGKGCSHCNGQGEYEVLIEARNGE